MEKELGREGELGNVGRMELRDGRAKEGKKRGKEREGEEEKSSEGEGHVPKGKAARVRRGEDK